MNGTDVLGADLEQYVVVRIRDVGKLVTSQGGSAGTLLYKLAPGTTTSKVYDEIKAELVKGFTDKKVDAEVTVTGNPPTGPRPRVDFLPGIAVGAGVVGLGFVIWNYVIKGLIRRRRT